MSVPGGIQARTLGHPVLPDPGDELVAWYRQMRERTRAIFSIPVEDAYYARPIALRNPIVFYEGHLPAFAINTLVKKTLGRRGVDKKLETLFARGIDPADESALRDNDAAWPSRESVAEYASEADARLERALFDAAAVPDACEAVYTIFEHELMHQETLLYMLHNLPHEQKRSGGPAIEAAPSSAKDKGTGEVAYPSSLPPPEMVAIPAGPAILGSDRSQFGWDNEYPRNAVRVGAFEIDRYNVTNGDYLEYMKATGAAAPNFWVERDGEWLWRSMFEMKALPLSWPVYVTHDEATAYAQWKESRLPTEAEYHRALGQARPKGNFDFTVLDPTPVGSFPPNEWGIYDLVGNGWEWTSTVFAGFEGFIPMRSYPEYSADFFDGQHFVMKGASPVTAREIVRPSFRNWFRPQYPYVYATFRCAR
jgi:gamma-glutamyl hercynylcysteine S-oxide synthase